jgi:hypothetical protein
MFGIVLFNQGFGGNHLTNLLNSGIIDNSVVYQNERIHLDGTHVIDDITEPVDHVVRSHFNNYMQLLTTNQTVIKKAKVFLLDMPERDSIPYKRLLHLFPEIESRVIQYEDLRALYSPRVLTAINPDVDYFLIDVKKLWDKDPEIIIGHIESTTPIKLNKEYCRKIHKIWTDKVGL